MRDAAETRIVPAEREEQCIERPATTERAGADPSGSSRPGFKSFNPTWPTASARRKLPSRTPPGTSPSFAGARPGSGAAQAEAGTAGSSADDPFLGLYPGEQVRVLDRH